MSEITTTGEWIKFFRNAGLPANVAANYSIIFVDNRIQTDMLMDLSKEYLYDMGIRVMGDVIAILKHAKEYHSELVKARMISDVPETSQRSAQKLAANRMLGRLTRAAAPRSAPLSSSAIRSTPPETSSKRTYAYMSKPAVISLKKRNPDVYEGPVAKRVRRVLPEEEGGYKIKMPSGSTERTRRILGLDKKHVLQSGTVKKSVFARLGESDVSSSTDIKRTKVSNVFDRLGSNSEVSTSTSGKCQPLQYQGVLKNTVRISTPSSPMTVTKIVGTSSLGNSPQAKRFVFNSSKELRTMGVTRINRILTQSAAMQTQTAGQRIKMRTLPATGGDDTNVTKRSIMDRLGGSTRLPTKTITVSRTGTNAVKTMSSRLGLAGSGMDSRLGAQTQRTVFDRLGN